MSDEFGKLDDLHLIDLRLHPSVRLADAHNLSDLPGGKVAEAEGLAVEVVASQRARSVSQRAA